MYVFEIRVEQIVGAGSQSQYVGVVHRFSNIVNVWEYNSLYLYQ